MTTKRVIVIYFLLVLISVLSSIVITRIGQKLPLLALLLTGKRPKKI